MDSQSMTKTRIVIIAGGGIAGTVVAIGLQRAGFAPIVCEAAPAGDAQRGAFLTVAVNGLSALRRLDLDPSRLLEAGFATPRLWLGNGRGRGLGGVPRGGPKPEGTTTPTTKRADLYAALRAEAIKRGITIAYGKRLLDYTEGGDG